MSLVPGLNPNIRLAPPPSQADDESAPVDIIQDDGDGDVRHYDARGRVIKIEHANGDVTISLDGSPLEDGEDEKPARWFDNLAERLEESELNRIAEDLMRGVDADLESREEWVENRKKGIVLMGMKIEMPGIGSGVDGAPVEGMSKVRHPLLQEAVLRFQANARGEMLPADGPVKVRNDSNNATGDMDNLADKLEKDFNHYLTTIATEFYPDTDRMLLMLGFGGTAFKKVYFCPLRNRPVSEHVDADDLIVNDAATDLANAKRITHRVMMRASTVKRLQILGVYRDIELGQPLAPKLDAVQREKKDQQGIKEAGMRPEDLDREFYEIYCELDIAGHEHKHKGKPSGLEIPYRVTIDTSSRQIVSLVRNYDEDTKKLPEAKKTFVKYTFVPGFGFYDIGLLHILGNTTNAVTAGWRILLDMGMYANFPGFLMADFGARQNSNILRVPPGGAATVKTNGEPIKDAVMPLPYSMQGAPALMQLVDSVAQTGMRVGGTSEMPVGEGRQDAPVGTTLALIEQATKILNSVHKRMHTSQAEEFQLFKQCFREHPGSFWQKNHKPAYPWDEKAFLQALSDCNLVPQADPNTASQLQRLMKVGALMQLSATAPQLYDPIAIHKMGIRALGFSNADEFMAPPEAMGKKPPELVKMEQEGQARLQSAQAQTMLAQARTREVDARAANEARRIHADLVMHQGDLVAKGGEGQDSGAQPIEAVKAQTALLDAKTRAKDVDARQADMAINAHNHQTEQESKLHLATMAMAKEVLLHQQSGQREDARAQEQRADAHADRQHEMLSDAVEHHVNVAQAEADRRADMINSHFDRKNQLEAKKIPGLGAKRKERASGGRVGVDDSEMMSEVKELLGEVREALTAEKEVIRGANNKIVGVRTKRRKRNEEG